MNYRGCGRGLSILGAVLWAALLPSVIDAGSLTDWAQVGEDNAIHIINLKDISKGNFSRKAGKEDDQVVIDFMDYQRTNSLKTAFTGGKAEIKGKLGVKDHENAEFTGNVAVKSPDHIVSRFEADSAQPFAKPYLSIRFNQAMLDRSIKFRIRPIGKGLYFKDVEVTSEHKGGFIWASPQQQPVDEIVIPMTYGSLKLSGFTAPVMLCKYGTLTGNIRIYLPENTRSSKGELNIQFVPSSVTFFNLRNAANMGFKDEKADDRQGGWTDQGARNDMRQLPTGKQRFGNVEFNVIDPNTNEGKSVMAFANPARPYFLKDAKIDGRGAAFDYLYLLHAGAWCQSGEVGKITVNYKDGGRDNFPVEARRDVGNWWIQESFPNAAVIWREHNGTSFVGLYLSRFKVKHKAVDSLVFTTSNNAVWLVVAASGVVGDLPMVTGSEQESFYTVEAGKEWKSFNFDRNIAAGSALDFSASLDAPAGKYGFLMVNGDQFNFSKKPGVPVRFMGYNLCNDYAVPKHEDADKLVEWIALRGYNAVRLHHFDELMMKQGATTPDIDPEIRDRFFYLFAKMKERGIYITLDLYTMRIQGFKQKYTGFFDVKSRSLFDQSIQDNILEFGRQLLGTVNPYTKLALKDDPALISVGLINEDSLFTHHTQYKYPNSDPVRNAMLKSVFEDWCRRNKLNPKELNQSMRARFAIDRHIEVFNKMKEYLRGIGVRVPISDMSATSTLPGAVARNEYDYVDNHFYLDHPRFPVKFFQMPYSNQNTSEIKELFPNMLLLAGSRIVGKPFMVTEFNYCAPNQYRGEGGPAISAVAALQGWNGIFRFGDGYSYRYLQFGLKAADNQGHLGSFTAFNDPIQGLSDRISSMFYLRGDVQTASGESVLVIPPDVWKTPEGSSYMDWNGRKKSDIPGLFCELGLYQRIGTKISNQTTPGEFSLKTVATAKALAFRANAPGIFDPQRLIVSSTGEITTDRKNGTMKVITPKSEALVVNGAALDGKLLSVKENTVFSTFFAGALDNVPLPESKRILVLHLTDVKATGQKLSVFRNQYRMYNWGNFKPYLVRRGSARISLASGSGNYTVKALDINGAMLEEIPATVNGGVITFYAATDCGPKNKAVFAYEITRSFNH